MAGQLMRLRYDVVEKPRNIYLKNGGKPGDFGVSSFFLESRANDAAVRIETPDDAYPLFRAAVPLAGAWEGFFVLPIDGGPRGADPGDTVAVIQ